MIAGKIVEMENIQDSIKSIGMFIVTTTVASLFHALVVLPSIYFLTVRKNPYRLLIGVGKALVTAFGTSSR